MNITPELAEKFVDRVRDMRHQQKEWFGGNKTKERLARAKQAERDVDALLDEIVGSQQARLFP